MRNKDLIAVKKIFVVVAAIALSGCSMQPAKLNPEVTGLGSEKDPIQSVKSIFSSSVIKDIEVHPNVSSPEVVRTIQELDKHGKGDDFIVKIEGELEWPLPYDQKDLGGLVKGKHAIVILDKESGAIKYMKMGKDPIN